MKISALNNFMNQSHFLFRDEDFSALSYSEHIQSRTHLQCGVAVQNVLPILACLNGALTISRMNITAPPSNMHKMRLANSFETFKMPFPLLVLAGVSCRHQRVSTEMA